MYVAKGKNACISVLYVLVRVSAAKIKCHGQNKLEEERVYYFILHFHTTVQIQGRNLEAGDVTQAKRCSLLAWILPYGLLILFYYSIQG